MPTLYPAAVPVTYLYASEVCYTSSVLLYFYATNKQIIGQEMKVKSAAVLVVRKSLAVSPNSPSVMYCPNEC